MYPPVTGRVTELVLVRRFHELIPGNGIDSLYYFLPKPLVSRIIMFATMPDQEEIQCLCFKWQRGRIKVFQQPQFHSMQAAW